MNDPVIRVDELRKSFRGNDVLRGVSFEVLPGQTFAFLGRNGAGKTTTIRTLMGLLKPDAGSVSILGVDPARHPLAVRKRVGYLAEDQRMFPWMSVSELISFVSVFYETWDILLAEKLRVRFELPLNARVKALSKGLSVRLGLLLALAHRPEVVILDDPILGLDPIMRKEFNRDLITLLQSEGRSVLYSSHLLYEVEPVADVVAILDKGQVIAMAETERLRDQVKKFVLPAEVFGQVSSQMQLLDVSQRQGEISATVRNAGDVERALLSNGTACRVVELNLDEIFEAFVIGRSELKPTPVSAI